MSLHPTQNQVKVPINGLAYPKIIFSIMVNVILRHTQSDGHEEY
jgi:hypothetical protein